VTNFRALHAGGKKVEAQGRGDKFVKESEQPSPSVLFSAGARPSRAPNIVEMRTSGADLTLGTGADVGSAKNISKRRKFGASASGVRQDFLYDYSWNEGRSEGTQRQPRCIGNLGLRHILVLTSLKQYCYHFEDTGVLPDWTKQFKIWTENLRERGDLKLDLKRGKKDRGYRAHLIFYALPTDLSPTVNSCKVPGWNKWDPALPLLFFQSARRILTNHGCLALPYADNFEHVDDVAESLQEVNVFEPLRTWTVRLDRPLFDVHRLCEVTLPLNCNAFLHCCSDVYFLVSILSIF
jgi:hypothetical protein